MQKPDDQAPAGIKPTRLMLLRIWQFQAGLLGWHVCQALLLLAMMASCSPDEGWAACS